MSRVLSGLQPSGQLHLGNYAGAIKQFLELQEQHELYVFVASYHALTSQRDPVALRAATRQVVIDYLAFGVDPKRVNIYRQQDVPEVTELQWLLSCICPTGWMDKATSYKDKLAKGLDATVGLYTYPVLQAADILAVDADIVPVGKDQVQHIELTRDMAQRFNNEFKSDTFKIPAYRLAKSAEVLPGTDGEKMSKSYGNTIDPFLPEKHLRKVVMSIKTDSTSMEDVKEPEGCPVYKIYRAIAGSDDARTADLAAKYRGGNFGYGHAKQALFELLLDHFATARARRTDLMTDTAYVDQVLASGAAAARTLARATVARAREAVGL